jgi:hypothetical protein
MRFARSLVAPLATLAVALATGCSEPPAFVSPAADAELPLDGALDVELTLPEPLPEGGRLVVTLLRGIDSDNVSSLDVSGRFTVDGTQALATLGAADLKPGRNTLYSGTDDDGDDLPDNLGSVTFRWDPLRAAACARVITPEVGVNHTDPIFLAGFSNNRRATGVHDDLWARGFVVQTASRKVAVVTLDLIGYFYNEVQTIRADPALATLGFDAVMVTSTHQHEGPDTMGLWGPDETTSGADQGYLDFVNEQVVGCLLDAEAALAPAEARFATGSTVGTSLPPWTDLVADGKVLQPYVIPGDLLLPPQPGTLVVEGDEGPVVNPAVPALQLRDAITDDVLATVVNYASHPEALGSSNTLVTSDFPHFMREALEARYGGVAIYVSADLGVLQGPLDVDVTDPVTDLPATRRTFRFAEVMGELLAERAASALDAATWQGNPSLEIASSGPLLVVVENPFFRGLATFGVFGRRELVEVGGIPYVETEVNALRFGPAQLAFTPNELDPQIGELYREQMAKAQHRWIVGLANDEIGYQLQEAKFNPSCFSCVISIIIGDPASCPIAIELGIDVVDCSTVFQNNIGPGADPFLQAEIGAVIEAITVPEPAPGAGLGGAVLLALRAARRAGPPEGA